MKTLYMTGKKVALGKNLNLSLKQLGSLKHVKTHQNCLKYTYFLSDFENWKFYQISTRNWINVVSFCRNKLVRFHPQYDNQWREKFVMETYADIENLLPPDKQLCVWVDRVILSEELKIYLRIFVCTIRNFISEWFDGRCPWSGQSYAIARNPVMVHGWQTCPDVDGIHQNVTNIDDRVTHWWSLIINKNSEINFQLLLGINMITGLSLGAGDRRNSPPIPPLIWAAYKGVASNLVPRGLFEPPCTLLLSLQTNSVMHKFTV
jgi:hypothetical protein